MQNYHFNSETTPYEERSVSTYKNKVDDKYPIQNHLINQSITKLIHELNQPITTIIAYVSGCIRRLQEDNANVQIVSILQKVIESTELLGGKINSLHSQIPQIQLMRENCNIHTIINEIISIFIHEIEENNITLEVDLNNDVPQFKINLNRIKIVLSNLIQLCIDIAKKNKVKSPKIEIRTEKTNSDSIVITIKNNIPFSLTNKKKKLEQKLELYRIILAVDGGILTKQSTDISSHFQLILPNFHL